MRLDFASPYLSITEPICAEEVPDFLVISGPNGAGKSHLLEAIEKGAILVNGTHPNQGATARRFVANQLAVTADGVQTSGSYRDRWVDLENNVNSAKASLLQSHPALRESPDQFEKWLVDRIVELRQLSRATLQRLTAEAGKPLREFTHNDFRRYSPLLNGIRDPFTLSMTEIFLSYHNRFIRNQFAQFMETRDGSTGESPGISDEEFESRFGVPPWTLLDQAAYAIGLEYTFVHPVGYEENLQFEATLKHIETGVEVSPGMLSSGEKTLLALAMTLYTGSRLGEAVELPSTLLLDEADSSLHPSMTKSLLRVIEDILVTTYRVKVIMTTHSPSTVALSPEESLYLMRRKSSPRLTKTTRDSAVGALTVGVSTLSISLDNRWVVFVESEYDEVVYQELYRILRRRLSEEVSLEFIASGRGGQGNSDAVQYLVKQLRQAGRSRVVGIVDRDQRNGADQGIYYDGERYAIENLVLNPGLLAVFLLRERILSPEDLGLDGALRHFELNKSHMPSIVTELTKRIGFADDSGSVDTAFVGDFTTPLPCAWSETQGHELKRRICETFPQLNKFASQDLLRTIIMKAAADAPDFIPFAAYDLFRRILASDVSTSGNH